MAGGSPCTGTWLEAQRAQEHHTDRRLRRTSADTDVGHVSNLSAGLSLDMMKSTTAQQACGQGTWLEAHRAPAHGWRLNVRKNITLTED